MKKLGKSAPSSGPAGHLPPGGKAVRTIIVEHPVYGRFEAVGVQDKLRAVQAAAKSWKLQWSKIAKECTFTEVDGSAGRSAPTKGGRGKDGLDGSG